MARMIQLFLIFMTLLCFPIIANDAPLFFLQNPLYQDENNTLVKTTVENTISLTNKEKKLIEHVKKSIDRAEKHLSKLDLPILQIEGMSNTKIRHFLNNICSLLKTSYLEVGCWKGSTFISALYKNEVSLLSATGIDNWSQFGSPKEEFHQNTSKFLGNQSYQFLEKDCFSTNTSEIHAPITTFFYDGSFDFISQKQSFIHFNPFFDDVFIAIVDDWNWSQVREGTYQAFNELGYTILYEIALPAAFTGDMQYWWNGLYVAVIRKQGKI